MIAKIAVAAANFAIDKPYSYSIPQDMLLAAGMRVSVPFGRGNRPTEGIVLSVEEGEDSGLKPVLSALDTEAVLSPVMLRLAAFLRKRYFCTFYDAARAMLPAGLWFHSRQAFSLTEDRAWENGSFRQPVAGKMLAFMQTLGGRAEDDQLRDIAGDDEAYDRAVAYLLKKKWICCHTDYRRRTGDKTEKIVTLCAPVEEVLAYAAARPQSAAMQRSVLETMCAVGSVSQKELCYYTGASSATVKRLVELGYLTFTDRPVLRCREIVPAKIGEPLQLNEEQTKAFDGLWKQMQQPAPGVALLHGVTGSGKTAVYLQLIRRCMETGKSAVLMVPEIALTPQLLGLLAAHFGDCVAVLHSSLSVAERYDQWKRVRSGQAQVIVGTRSAVFAPCPSLGLLILDEEQEHSYKSENSPRYCAREVAMWRGIKEKALVLLGSATPSVETMYHAKAGHYALYTLENRYNGRPLPDVELLDMREDLKEGNDLSISLSLLEAMRENVKAKKQTILFLNRRGNSRAMVCVDCRQAPECPRCSARLTYHSANGRLMCHHCGYSVPVPQKCPACGGPMKAVGIGTQKVQQELATLFPEQAVVRMDTDTVSAVNTHEKILERFRTTQGSILVGTQMVAKGLNLPDVTLVGVLDADLGLYSDSYRAAETTFNMLTQVVGRAGRGDSTGRAVIQTLVPQHKVMELAARQDYKGFYDLEIAMRRVQGAPPFGDLVTVTFTGMEEARVLHGASKFRDSLLSCLSKEEAAVLGPAPCAVPKINYHFRYRLTMRCRMDDAKRELLAHMLRQFSRDRDNRRIAAFVDVNGYE